MLTRDVKTPQVVVPPGLCHVIRLGGFFSDGLGVSAVLAHKLVYTCCAGLLYLPCRPRLGCVVVFERMRLPLSAVAFSNQQTPCTADADNPWVASVAGGWCPKCR
jgi:hypothetical protein